jgi:RNA polymerase sigma factor (sigma-70 family)
MFSKEIYYGGMTKKDPDKKERSQLPLQFKELTDKELLEYFVDHDIEAAFNEFVDRHGQMVLSICLSVVANRECAEDAFQATFLALVRNARRLRNATSISGWLCRVARNAAIKASQQRRKRERQLETSEPTIDLDPLEHLAAREVVLSLAEELEAISSRYREALTLFYFESLTRREIADRMGCTEKAVKSLLQRGKQLLRNRLMRKGIVPAMVVLSVQAISRIADAGVTVDLVSETTAFCTRVLSHGTVPSHLASLSTKCEGPIVTFNSIGVISITGSLTMAASVLLVAFAVSNLQSEPSQANADKQFVLDSSSPQPENNSVRIFSENHALNLRDEMVSNPTVTESTSLSQAQTDHIDNEFNSPAKPEPSANVNHRTNNRTDSIISTRTSSG